ncbi:GIY-YIG nuclease family protein [Ramlibacter sp. G-1-2-2]|uniref:GIY-YIG nuclease family protein n=1 Tax=Ramlibacter agri TaxID=2728837 RepID=A0A848H4L5_9BURK|nr:GIY-YIG nuclease family protein [Ramlibacter agri]NML44449.1 GIY-YIG nuclease family protein [Ramlibacter agri]
MTEAQALKALPPLADRIIEKAVDNMTRKLVAGYRNKRNARPNAKTIDLGAETKETLAAVSAESVVQVANRGQAWKELIQKSLSAGISSIGTIQFDGEFQVRAGQRPDDFDQRMPNTPGVYVVFDDSTGKPTYVGDSENMRKRWHAGHFNEYQQAERAGGERYKLADQFENGCTVKFIKMESKESAAALEAHLIRENFGEFEEGDDRLKNKREELLTEQGTRSNQEAKKLKDASGSTASLAKGAAGEAFKNVGYDVLERLANAAIKAVKDELVDVFGGGKAKMAARIQRFLDKILVVLRGVIEKPLQLLRGVVEFVVNALSKAIGQVLNMARNLFDLANGAWNLYRGAANMSREELVRKISETVIVSGSLVIWDALDQVMESNLAVLGPFAPYVSSAVAAIGFGLSSHALQGIVTRIIDAIVAFKQGFLESLENARASCEQLIRNAERELEMMADLRDYLASTIQVMDQMRRQTAVLSQHQAIQPLDIRALLPKRS